MKNLILLTSFAIFLNQCNVAFADLDTGLVSYYPFNGNANDESGNGYNGVVYGNPQLTEDRFNEPNSAYRFDGIDDYISLGEIGRENYVTVSAWIKLFAEEDADVYYAPVMQSFGSILQSGYGILIHTNEIWIRANELEGVSINQFSLYDNRRWHHLAMSYDGYQLRGYIDGQQVYAESHSEEEIKPLTYGSGQFETTIGKDLQSGETDFFRGAIDDVRIYNRALSQQEISELYVDGNTLSCKTLSAQNLDPANFENREITLNCEEGYIVVSGGAECYDYANWYGRLTQSVPRGNGWAATCMRYDYNGTETNEGAQIIKTMHVRCCKQ